MGLLSRYTQKLFGSTAGANRIGQFGSLANGSPIAYSGTTVTPANIQALANFLSGLDGSLVAGSTTPIQDMNALHYLWSYQLSYLMQQGVAEWDSATTYNSNSLVVYGTTLYQSLIANNTSNTPTSGSPWAVYAYARKTPTQTILTSGPGTYTKPSGATWLKVTMVGGGGGGSAGYSTIANGSNGGATTFGTSFLVAGGGTGGGQSSEQLGGAGGTASIGAGATGISYSGATGNPGATNSGSNSVQGSGGSGGASPLGGAGAAGVGNNNNGIAALAYTGSGGGGGGGGGTSNTYPGGGGGSGGYLIAWISNPASSYSYAIGAAGAGGAYAIGGGSAASGGSGGSGIIIIEEFYS